MSAEPASWGTVGRDAELDLIDAVRARSGTAVVIGGPAGVGKTRVLREAVTRARRDGWAVEELLASEAASGIPLAACAGLWRATGVETAEAATSRIVAEVRDRRVAPTLLVVDDAHLLDRASAHVVAVLARDEGVTALLTFRTPAKLADSIRGLWRDADGARVELQALSEREIAELGEAMLGGAVDQATARRLYRQCGGNVLFLRELLSALRERGALQQQHGAWRWTGGAVISPALDEIIGEHIDRLGAPALRLLQYVAFGEPLDATVASRLGDDATLLELERAALVELHTDDRRRSVRLGHPLYGEVVRHRTREVARRAVYASLVDALRATGASRRDDRFRIAVWQLAAGEADDPAALMAAALEARSRGALDLMQRLADAAAALDGSVEAKALAAQALKDRGQDEAARAALEAILAEPAPDRVRLQVIEPYAALLAMSLGRVAEAIELLTTAHAEMNDPAVRAILRALVAALQPDAATGLDPDTAARIAEEAVDANAAEAALLLWIGEVQSALLAGRFAVAVDSSRRMVAPAWSLRDVRPEALGWVTILRVFALMHGGALDEAEALAATALERSAEQDDGRGRAWWLDLLGTLAVERGDASRAVAHLEEAAALRRVDDRGTLAGTLFGLAVARALLGDAEGARAALTEGVAAPVTVPVPMIEVARAEAALLAVQGRITAARDAMIDYARRCDEEGRRINALWAWRDAARFGAHADARAALRELARHVDPPLPDLFAAAAAALADRDTAAMIDAAHRLEEHGFLLDATELLATAAARAATTGDPRLAQRCAREVAARRARLPGVVTPMLIGHETAPWLSAREREVALLAAAGHRDADIAGMLVVSVRTVHAHLRAVYTKLGITRRDEIAAALQDSGDEPDHA